MAIRQPRPPERPDGDLVVSVLLFAGVLIIGWLWAAAELAGRMATGRWPRIPLGATVGVVFRLPSHFAEPRAAWPARYAPGLAGAGWFYLAAAVLALFIAVGSAAGVAVYRSDSSGPNSRHKGARWARGADLRGLTVARPGRAARLVLGRHGRRPVMRSVRLGRRGGLIATESRHSVLVMGPTQSGKTTGLAIPALLEWKGPIVATSVKDDLVAHTVAWRGRSGPVWVFDPTRSCGAPAFSRWSPLSGSASWSDAQRMATWLVESTPGRKGLADAAFWYATAAKQLAPMLLAAERAGLGMTDVVRWSDSEEFAEPARLLEISGEQEAALALGASAGRDERIRSSVGTTLETVLAPFADPVVASSTSRTDVDVGGLLDGPGTLYLCGPSHEQSRVQGVFAALVSTVIQAAVARVGDTGRPLDPPLLLVLDEVANIAPIRDLDTLASTGAGFGIQLVTVCQDLAQLAARYDPERARTIANNHRAKVLLSGVSDLGTLDLVSGLAGEHAVRDQTTTHDLRDGRRTRSTSTVFRRLAPTDELRRTPPGEAVLVYGHLPPARLRLRPWYRDPVLRRRADERWVSR